MNGKEKIIETAVCPFCACLCDDVVISVDVERNRIKEIRNACTFGVEKFLSVEKTEQRLKKPVVDGKKTDYDDAIEKAVDILNAANKPLIYGLGNSGYNAQRVALEIAKLKKGVYDFTESICHNVLYLELLKKGPFYYALLDEIRDNAQVVIYWGANPIVSHPRHLSKYSVYPVGRYAMKGVMDRELITIDVVDSELKKISRWFLRVNPGEDAEIANILRRLVKGESLKELVTGKMDSDTLRKMADRLKKAFYGVIFVGLGVLSNKNGSKSIESILALVDTLNKEGVKFVLFPMKGHFNVLGAVNLLLRETGYPFGVDFSRDTIFEPGKTTVLDVIASGEVDAALIVGADPFSSFPMKIARKLRDLPIILMDPFETPTTQFASVVIPTAITGVETEEIAYRMDGLPLKLEKIVDCKYPPDRAILEQIRKGVKKS
uniref:Assimilatory nitrate reductase n=1 Tax=Candidatus Methanophaga sp. ANME-1 ERB7 TaxID=2759913 RepID=A0A7G9Z3X9_9EURY|nr:assimilatory nitrate reductase [Methanosarcinales archaeon ANME-1 ERB7]